MDPIHSNSVDVTDFINFRSYRNAHFHYGFTKNNILTDRIHLVDDKHVIKSFVLNDKEDVKECIEEYKIAKKMSMLGIGPKVYSLFQVGGKIGYILMRKCTWTLYDYVMENYKFEYESQLRELIYRISHSDMLYMDMKPSNIMISLLKDGTVDMRFIDFDPYFCKEYYGKYGAHMMMMLMFFSTLVSHPWYRHPFACEKMPDKKVFQTEVKKNFSVFIIIKDIIWEYFAKHVMLDKRFHLKQMYTSELLVAKKILTKHNCVDVAIDLYYRILPDKVFA